VELSVVVPCLDEADVIEPLLAALDAERALVGRRYADFEVLVVDDGSTDATLDLVKAVAARDPRVRYLALSRNFGKEAAMLAGLAHAQGRAVAIMDADLQHPPRLLGRMLELLEDGADQVVARRTRTGDSWARTRMARGFYRALNAMSEVRVVDGAGDFRLLGPAAVRAILSMEERNRFSKGLFAWIGLRTSVVDYDNVARPGGGSHWRFRSLVRYGLDGLLSFNFKPLRLALYLGLFVTTVAVVYAAWVLGRAVVVGVDVPGYVTLVCTVVWLGGVQLIMLGVLGEYLGRIYLEVKQRPHYIVASSSSPATELPDLPEVSEQPVVG
jgi:glycosyltransferase involved in cell wall biosynthesis